MTPPRDARPAPAGTSGFDARAADRIRRLFSSYVLNLQMGAARVRDLIVGDISRLRDLGAHRQADDLEAVLDCFLARYPEV
ncbi:MAG TPA: hypothetical protein VK446_04650 [Methylocystis sp.]|nr:hypothetical protein [Methylocystis sp.]